MIIGIFVMLIFTRSLERTVVILSLGHSILVMII
jgi:hypothetical protein